MGQARLDVVGIGNAIVDVVAGADDALLAEEGLPKGSMTLIDGARADALRARMGRAVEVSGGSAANTVVGAARLGAAAGYVGKVRDDAAGAAFRRDIEAAGVGFPTPAAADGAATARCLIFVTPDAQRTMGTHLGACVELGPADVDPDFIARASLLYLEGYLWDPPAAKEAFRKALGIAHAAGGRVCLSLSDSFCVERHRAELRDLVARDVDVLFANEDEAAALYEVGSFEDALAAARADCAIAALTRSAPGSVVAGEGAVHVIEAAPVAQVVDTTGAGDLYASGFLAGLARGFALDRCGRLASLAAGEIIGHYGARPEADIAPFVEASREMPKVRQRWRPSPMSKNSAADLRTYRREFAQIYATGQATEHSYRHALQALIQALGGSGVRALNEPTQIACGAPDFIVEHSGVPIGHVECKDVGADLNRVERNDQLRRYREGLPNLILTDYLEFRWYVAGELREAARIGRLDSQGKVASDKAGSERVKAVFDAFFSASPPTVHDPRELSERMAAKARLLRDGIGLIFRQEGQRGPLHDLLNAYRDVLIGGLQPDDFADLQAQTAAYGLFAARCLHDPKAGPFTRETAAFADTTPFLRDVFGRIAGPGIDSRIAWIVDDLALLLDRADMAAILEDFGRRTRREDPVVHFYEDFLVAYDPELREVRGVYYTPEPVVSYIVRSVDRLLRERFGLADGLAETAAGGDDGRPVLILDPAAGTGTFLREVVARIRETIEGKGLSGAWPDYVRHHLLPRLFGFELLMAPYAICHLKLALEIGGTDAGYKLPDGQRLGVFLTNTLEEPHDRTAGALFAHEIAQEAASADSVKRDKPVMVVLGNPPYSGHSANRGAWIAELIERYKRGFPELKKPAQAKWLSDDYVKFLRFAQWRIERTGEGVLGFVTNHAYLDNPTFRGMRRSLIETFDEIYLLDLHGNAKRGERAPDGSRDENVFDIQQGVAIGLFVKRAEPGDDPARVFHADLWGEREAGPDGGKYGWLAANDIGTTRWAPLAPKHPLYLFAPRDEALIGEYEASWTIPAIFSPNGDPAPGIVTTHDQFAISWTPEEAAAKVERLLATESEAEAREIWRLCSQDQWQYDRAKRELADGHWRGRMQDILYRPFDNRTTVFDRNVAVHRRERVMRHMLAGPNLGISTTRSTEIAAGWEHVFVSNALIQHHTVSLKEVNYLFPLYTYPKKGREDFGRGRKANLDLQFVEEARAALGLDFVADGAGDLAVSFGPEDIFHYIYAVLHSPEYRRRYADFLKSDFPRVPLTGDRALFATLVGLGGRLAALHLMEADGEEVPTFPVTGDNRVGKVHYTLPNGGRPGRVWINDDQYFDRVRPRVWMFTIGGYRPAEKWLKDRKGRVLSFDDIAWYCRVCAALAETPPIMRRIDDAINERGGWPLT